VGLAFVFVAVVGSGVFDLIQVIVRIWNPSYQSGLPSAIAHVALLVGTILLCVAILAAFPPSGSRPGQSSDAEVENDE